MRRWQVFLGWALVLAVVWAFANWPRDGGELKRFLRSAGFPWTFAFRKFGRLDFFDTAALAADIGLGLVVVVVVAALCAWSRPKPPGPPPS